MYEMEITKIGTLIYVVRGQRVMLDRDLAALYGAQTGALNQAVKRNRERFPDDFMFQLNAEETRNSGLLTCPDFLVEIA
ncbi:MAG: ORF6N domain-containing protein [Elusimicrobia bacterium]|nr:ORF6N domain-containing protein [Elusimicrobiota bacterium]